MATFAAADTTRAAFVTAMGLASDGDTVTIPAGGPTAWASPVTVAKQLVIQGAGKTSTLLTGHCFTISLTTNGPVRLTAIGFSRSTWGSSDSMVLIDGKDDDAVGVAHTQVRIDHCNFTNGGRQVSVTGWAYGVLDHNEFVNGNIAVGFTGDNTESWNRAIEVNTSNSMYIEDNTFTVNNSRQAGQDNEQIYHQDGGRSVTRYNTFDFSALTNGEVALIFDNHGDFPNGGSWPNGSRGQPICEFYRNIVTITQTYRYMNIRGGTNIVHHNTFSHSGSGPSFPYELTEEESWDSGGPFSPTPFDTAWPAHDQVTNSFFWSNTLNGVAVTDVGIGTAEDEEFIQENRDYFLHEPAASGGKSTWPGQAGDDDMTFSASGANKFYPYTEYTYPHPLVSGTTPGTMAFFLN